MLTLERDNQLGSLDLAHRHGCLGDWETGDHHQSSTTTVPSEALPTLPTPLQTVICIFSRLSMGECRFSTEFSCPEVKRVWL